MELEKAFQHIPVHKMIQILGPEKSLPLPQFHPFSVCDTTLSFLGIGTKTAWATCQAYTDISDDLRILTVNSFNTAHLERWTFSSYSTSIGCSMVNGAIRQFFTNDTRTLIHTPLHMDPASACTKSSVLGSLYMEICKATTSK